MNHPVIQLVVAYSDNRVIGKDNNLPWKLPSDLAHFKRTTMGQPIIMGRKTWESIGKPLPGRENLVITRSPNYQAKGAHCFPSLQAAITAFHHHSRLCVIGGAQLYKEALSLADEIIATEIHANIEGDAWFPTLPTQEWKEVQRQPQIAENGYDFDFVTYQRRLT